MHLPLNYMPINQPLTYVIWGKKFSEVPTVIFVTELRQAGIKVQVVGLDNRQISGCHGMALQPDIMLSQALPTCHLASCIILPCGEARLRWLLTDPRFSRFLATALAHQALLVVSQACMSSTTGDLSVLVSAENVLGYPNHDVLVQFARDLTELVL